jgi:2',3'-cyclic-nucleotide 2'-phosphodiesterase (5'-nucleotidase family)
MGGLARRVGYENALSKQVNGEVPVLQLDAGHMFSDDFNVKGMAEDVRAKDEWVLRAYDQFHIAAANVSPRDLPYLGEMMGKDAYKANLKKYPMLGRILSANAVPASKDVMPFKPYTVEEVRGKRLGSKPLRVGIIGVTEKPLVAGAPTGGYSISDPVEAAKKLVPELRKKCDLVVVLAYVDRDTAKRIGVEAPGIDLVLAAHQFPLYNAVDEAGDAVVAYVASQTKWLGEVRLYRSGDAKNAAITNYVHRDVPLDTVIPDDPAAAKTVADARAQFQKGPAPPDAAHSRGH